MSNYLVKDTALSYEAARIRAKTGSAAQITFDGDKGFGDAIDAIPSGGGYSEDGFVDVVLSSPDYVSCEIEGNHLSHFTTVLANRRFSFLLKRPINIKNGDVIEFSLENIQKAGAGWSSCSMLTIPFGEVPINENFSMGSQSTKNVTVRKTEETFDAYEVYAIILGPRHTVIWDDVNADLHLSINGQQLF